MNKSIPDSHCEVQGHIVLSVVIIGRNEAKNIARCIDSVIKAADALSEPYEIIFVDSASEDDSVKIACKYQVRVIRIEPGEWRCAAAGRALGTRYAKGEYIAYFDGDMACDPDWIKCGIRYLREGNERLGAVTGSKEYRCMLSGKVLLITQDYASASVINKFGGSAIISQKALSLTEGFHPYMIANEEEDLSDRISRSGFAIMGLPCKMITHYGLPPSLEETLRRGSYGYNIGLGQYVRRLWKRGQRRKALLKIKVQIAFTVWVISVIVLLLYTLFKHSWLPACIAVGSIPPAILVFILRVKNIRRGFNMFYSQFSVLPGLVSGLYTQEPANTYEPKHKLIQ